jgi:BirA family biotin operon repressor/biotin-[acetyl-CoA-carboxylase] ligase
MNLERIRAAQPTREIYWHETIDSTMNEAVRLALLGCPSGTLVGADEQTRGQGRYGRYWDSRAGEGLYVSEVLRLAVRPEELPVITLTLGLAVQEAILKATDLACDLRWPNDVLAGGKKCAGILVQLHERSVVAGIGINVNQTEFPPELAPIATSLKLATRREQSREALLLNLIESIDTHCAILVDSGKNAILDMFSEASSFVRGRRVVVSEAAEHVEGVTEGLDPSGFLVLRTQKGERKLIMAGGVRPAP